MSENSAASSQLFGPQMASSQEIVVEARNGRMFILIDSDDEEAAGNLVMPAQMTTRASVNFMAQQGKGLVSLAITQEHADHFGLTLIPRRGASASGERCTVSIEARVGVSTGISANDRASTIMAALNYAVGRDGLVTPGHVFPIVASAGGVLERARRAEAAVDIARLAGLNPSGVICEILNDDGMVAGLDYIRSLARQFGLKIGTIRDLVAYRREHDHEIERVSETDFESRFGGNWRIMVFRNRASGVETLALTMGPIDGSDEPVLVRMHQHSFLADSLGEMGGREGLLAASMKAIAEAGCGVIVLINRHSPTYFSDTMLTRIAGGAPIEMADFRDYGGGAQILAELGVRDMILLSNRHTSQFELGVYGLKVVGVRALEVA